MRARREVITAAGPYGSPKLLQLSGIGPAAVLRRAGVPLVLDLPVGASVQVRRLSPLPRPAPLPGPPLCRAACAGAILWPGWTVADAVGLRLRGWHRFQHGSQ